MSHQPDVVLEKKREGNRKAVAKYKKSHPVG